MADKLHDQEPIHPMSSSGTQVGGGVVRTVELSGWLRPDRLQALGIKVVTVCLLLWGWATIDNFASAPNLHAIMYSMAAVGIAAVGMAFITLSGNLFMLSMGATAAVSTIIFASTLHFGIGAALLAVACAGGLIGLAQGIAVGVAGANPIIATIAMASIITGIGSLYSGGQTVVGAGDASWLGVGNFLGIVPNQIVLFLLVAVLAELVVERTRFGRELRLIGMNFEAAHIAGFRIPQVLIIAFVIAGIAAALSGGLLASQSAQGNLKLGAGLDFDAIAAVLVGGVSIKGGRGRISDAAFGALFLAVVSNILLVKGLAFEVQLVVKGLVVVVSVILGALVSRGRR
jgi:ribose/xylose/arabinose/galactoside ABC-type transport system permease subunit